MYLLDGEEKEGKEITSWQYVVIFAAQAVHLNCKNEKYCQHGRITENKKGGKNEALGQLTFSKLHPSSDEMSASDEIVKNQNNDKNVKLDRKK